MAKVSAMAAPIGAVTGLIVIKANSGLNGYL